MTPTATALATPQSRPAAGFDAERVRRDFPILAQPMRGKRLVYLDSASSAQKPQAVIDAVAGCYRGGYANIHRGLYDLAQRVDAAYEGVRERVRAFLGAAHASEIVFLRGTTEAINLVAQTFGRRQVGAGDEVLVTALEHHSNIVPWQLLCEEKGARLQVAPIDDRGDLIVEEFAARLGPRTRLVGLTHVSNALGTVNPVRQLIALAHDRGIPVLVDGAQAAPHLPIDVGELGCDFYAFSGHKLFAPSAIGVLYGRRELLAAMPPWQGGGDMIRSVSFAKTEFADPPARFEAGTPNIAGVVAFATALDYLAAIGMDQVRAHELDLTRYALARLGDTPGVTIFGPDDAADRGGVISFALDGVHPHDIGQVLDDHGVAIRAGHHCAQPLMAALQVPATARASFYIYNTRDEVDALVDAVEATSRLFGTARA